MGIPSKIIIAWAGTINQIPDGWFLCDGQNGTPNLLDKSIIGSGSSFAFDSNGGSADLVLPSHNHIQNSVNETNNHSHTLSGRDAAGTSAGTLIQTFTTSQGLLFDKVWGNNAGSHSHTLTLANTGTPNIENTNMPPYYALAFIMKGGE